MSDERRGVIKGLLLAMAILAVKTAYENSRRDSK